MCGIAGILHLDGRAASVTLLQRMTARLAHRGPDGQGHWHDGPLALGHRRLAVIDLTEAASQPMQTRDGRWVISYNGEVYNFRELRQELAGLGHQFQSRSDTEVVLHALDQWGTDALPRLNGMFALAAWDRDRQRLLLARDRYGIKPLYYALLGDTLLFASEVKALLAHDKLTAEIDLEGLLEYFTFQNFFTDRTLFRHVRLLPAGYWWEIRRDGPASSPRQYWDFQFREPEQPRSAAEYEEQLVSLFEQAVRRHLVSDVEVGAYLSGGMDSGSITAVAARELPFLRSFTCGFDLHSASGLELAFDEREAAEHMSYLFKTEHYEMVLKAGDMERVLPQLAWHLEEPRVGQSYPNFYVAKLAAKFGKVVLAGTGSDELFGGYPWRYYRAVVNDNFEDYIDKYYVYWQRLIPNRTIHRVFRPIWPDIRHVWTRDVFRDVFRHHAPRLTRPEDYINHSLYLEAKTFLHGLLVVEDKLSMAHGLETRLPFLDNDLVDFASSVPVRLKLADLAAVVRLNENESGRKSDKYFQRTRDGKLLLRQAMQRDIPASITQSIKQGFSAPDATWFKGDSIDYVRDTLYDPQSPVYDFMDRQEVQALLDEHLEGRKNRRLLIWSLLNFHWWCRLFLQGEAIPPAHA